MTNFPFNIGGIGGDMLGELTQVLSLPEFVLKELIEELEKEMNEKINDREVINQTKMQISAAGGSASLMRKELDEFKKFLEISKESNEFDNEYQEKILVFISDYLEKITNIIETEGLVIPMDIPVQILKENVTLPAYAKFGDAGCDVSALEDVEIPANGTVLVKTGIACAVPVGYEIQVRLRSSLGLKTPLRVPNAPGTVDSGYRGEIGVILWNTSNEPYTVKAGERIAQLVLAKVEQINWSIVEDVETIGVSRTNEEGESGFGSTGK